MTKNLLFIGLGVMGNPMAENLISCPNFRVKVYDIDRTKAHNLEQKGAVFAENLGDIISKSDIIMTSLPGPAQVEQVAFNDDGLFANMCAGTTWLELSTNNHEVCEKLVVSSKENSIDLLDCPVSGGDEGAKAGSLTILVGGDPDVYQENLPVLKVIGQNIRLLGPSGAGYAAKIAQVVLCYVHSLALSEAMMLGVKGGVDVGQMLSIIQSSTGKSYVADRYGPCIVNGDYDPSFTIGLAHKDMKLAMDMADKLGIELPLCDLTTRTYSEAIQCYGFDANHLKAVRLLEDSNNVFLQSET